VGALRNEPLRLGVDAHLIEQRRERNAGPLGAGAKPVQRLYIALDRLLRVERRAVAAAFHEGDARHHWITMQSIDRVDHRLAHRPRDQDALLGGVVLVSTATSNYKMQAIRRDRAVKKIGVACAPRWCGARAWGC